MFFTVQDQVNSLRMKHGGNQLAIFKIGISHSLERQFVFYQEKNFDEMWCIHATNSLAQVEVLEAALIDYFTGQSSRQCRNVLRGGEGMRASGFPKYQAPYFVYVVASNAASKPRWIGRWDAFN